MTFLFAAPMAFVINRGQRGGRGGAGKDKMRMDNGKRKGEEGDGPWREGRMGSISLNQIHT